MALVPRFIFFGRLYWHAGILALESFAAEKFLHQRIGGKNCRCYTTPRTAGGCPHN